MVRESFAGEFTESDGLFAASGAAVSFDAVSCPFRLHAIITAKSMIHPPRIPVILTLQVFVFTSSLHGRSDLEQVAI